MPFNYPSSPEISALVVSYPVFVNDEHDGFIVGILNLTKLYNFFLARFVDEGYTFVIEHDGGFVARLTLAAFHISPVLEGTCEQMKERPAPAVRAFTFQECAGRCWPTSRRQTNRSAP